MRLNEIIRSATHPKQEPQKVVLDSADEVGGEMRGAADYTLANIAMMSVSMIQQWVESDDLADGETCADRLLALMVGIADANKDGDITEDEQGVLESALEAAWDYLVSKGVSEEDADALLNDFDNDVAERVKDFIASVLPEGEDEESADIDNFVFGDGDQEPALDAAYKMKFAIRNGKKTRIRKRISGTVRLSAAQKVGIRKAQMKSHSAAAQMRRAKSMRIRRKSGL